MYLDKPFDTIGKYEQSTMSTTVFDDNNNEKKDVLTSEKNDDAGVLNESVSILSLDENNVEAYEWQTVVKKPNKPKTEKQPVQIFNPILNNVPINSNFNQEYVNIVKDLNNKSNYC